MDRGYKGHGVKETDVYISGQRRGMTWSLKRQLKRRSAIEPHIGHMKSDGKLGRNYLKGLLGAKINAALCAIGHNMRLLLNHIRALFALFLGGITGWCWYNPDNDLDAIFLYKDSTSVVVVKDGLCIDRNNRPIPESLMPND